MLTAAEMEEKKQITTTKRNTTLWEHRDWELLTCILFIFICPCGRVHKGLAVINAFCSLLFPVPLSAFL